jgi:hypothetical protein
VNENPYIDGMKSLIHPETPNIHMNSEVNEYPYPRFETLHSPTNPTHTHGCIKPLLSSHGHPAPQLELEFDPISRLYLPTCRDTDSNTTNYERHKTLKIERASQELLLLLAS